MAPEQARGEAVDKRADIWAFGVVLWEMLCGRRLFGGATTSDTLTNVLRAELDFDKLPAGTPISIRRLLRRCLERDRKNRLQAIGDARLEIEEYLADPVGEVVPPGASYSPGPCPQLCWPRWSPSRCFTSVEPTREPVDEVFDPGAREEAVHAPRPFSRRPHDRFIAGDSQTEPALGASARLLDAQPWPVPPARCSPSGRPIAAFSASGLDGKLKKIDVVTPPGRPQTLCDAPEPGGATWSQDGVIVFSAGRVEPCTAPMRQAARPKPSPT